MTMLDHRESIRTGVQPMEYEVAGCVARRLERMTVRGKLDEDSACWLCGCVHKIAIPRHAGTLRAAERADQQKQAWRTGSRDTRRDTVE